MLPKMILMLCIQLLKKHIEVKKKVKKKIFYSQKKKKKGKNEKSWTTEATIIDGIRINKEELAKMLESKDCFIFVVEELISENKWQVMGCIVKK